MRFCDVTGLPDFDHDECPAFEMTYLGADEVPDRMLAQRRIEFLLSEHDEAESLLGDGYAAFLSANLWVSGGTWRFGLIVDLLESDDCIVADWPEQDAEITACISTASCRPMDEVLDHETDGLVVEAMAALGRLHVPLMVDSMHVWLTEAVQALRRALFDGLTLPNAGFSPHWAAWFAGQLPTEEDLLERILLQLGELYHDTTVGHLIRPTSVDRGRLH